MPVEHQRAECERLAGRPVDPLAGVDRRLLGFELARDLRVEVEVLGRAAQRRADLAQLGVGHRGRIVLELAVGGGLPDAGPRTLEPVRLVGLVALRGIGGFREPDGEGVPHVRRRLRRDHALLLQLRRIERARGALRADLPVHGRLREGRLVALVVAVAAVADEIEHHVGLELAPIGRRQLGRVDHRLDLVAVHVEDRRLHGFGDIGAVESRVGMRRDRGEADLVVHHQVQRAAGAIADQLAHRERLVDQPLARRTPRRRA